MCGMAMDMNSGGEPGLELRVSEPFRKQGHRSLFQVREGGSQPAGGCSDYSNEAESFICGQPLSGGVLWGQRVLAQSLTWRRLMTVSGINFPEMLPAGGHVAASLFIFTMNTYSGLPI